MLIKIFHSSLACWSNLHFRTAQRLYVVSTIVTLLPKSCWDALIPVNMLSYMANITLRCNHKYRPWDYPEMERLSCIIQLAQSYHMNHWKWRIFPGWVRMMKKKEEQIESLKGTGPLPVVLKMEEEGYWPRNPDGI